MQALRLGIQAGEPTPLAKLYPYRQTVRIRMIERHDPQLRTAQYRKAKRLDSVLNSFACAGNEALFGSVTLNAKEVHHRPGRRDRPARARAGKRRSDHSTARPVIEVEDHELLERCRAEENSGGALRAVAVFVEISRDGMHAG